MRSGRVLFCVFLMIVSGGAIFMARDWPFNAALFPLAVSFPLLLLAGGHLILLLNRKEETTESAAVDLEFTSELAPAEQRRRVIAMFGWIAGFIASVFLIGFPLTVPLFILFYLRCSSAIGWLGAAAAAALTWAVFYGLFQKLVHLQFEQGALQAWFGL